MNKIRKFPIICLVVAIIKLLSGSLRFYHKNVGNRINSNTQGVYIIFRHIGNFPVLTGNCVFIVSFKFNRLSHPANKVASVIPMLLIAGFPGFIQKIYAVNPENGYWQGMYEWKSIKHLEAYKRSFVYRMMNKRAIPDSIKTTEFIDKSFQDIAFK